jgi:hypothetical protein
MNKCKFIDFFNKNWLIFVKKISDKLKLLSNKSVFLKNMDNFIWVYLRFSREELKIIRFSELISAILIIFIFI